MKILIVEDEFHIGQYIEKLIAEYFAHQELKVFKVVRLNEAIQFVDKEEIDLLMLDLNLNGKDGFELLQLITAKNFHTIIVSAYKDRAIEAFEYGVLDFVPKPFTRERLHQALSRLGSSRVKPAYPIKYFTVKKRGRIEMINSSEVTHIEAYGHYSKLHLPNEQVEIHDKSLSKLEILLGEEYVRIHKSFIVKTGEMQNIHIQDGGRYEIQLKNGTVLPLGRSRYKRIKKRWF